ncbi:MAG TPA: hypothetical protein RMH99_21230 [Sandaracinaceae bacterium LLY-WYZ-13_1]|nr:hypothetical protein [Sandaracinaceae bacterium LLY-WYZ-13_1]
MSSVRRVERAAFGTILGLVVSACAASPAPHAARCALERSAPIDCEAACAHYRAAHDARRSELRGEIVPPEACPSMCRAIDARAEVDTRIQWGCLARHPACSDAADRCQRACLAEAGQDRDPARLALCLPPEASEGS